MNYRGKAALTELDSALQVVGFFNNLSAKGNSNLINKWIAHDFLSEDFYSAFAITGDRGRTDLELYDTTSLFGGVNKSAAQKWNGELWDVNCLAGLPAYQNIETEATTAKFSRMLTQQMATAKSGFWNYSMYWPIPLYDKIKSFSFTHLYGGFLKSSMVNLSNEFFLKYAYHVESHKNVWDIQYKATNLAKWYEVDKDLRLPYPVVWFEAPEGGYLLNKPKKRLDDRLQKQSSADGWEPLYNRRIGGILVVEADILPVDNHIPDEGKENMLYRNMIWQIPMTAFQVFDDKGTPVKMMPKVGGSRQLRDKPWDILLSDLEVQYLFKNELNMISGRVDSRLPWNIDWDKHKHSLSNHNYTYHQAVTTHPLPMHVVEQHFSWKGSMAKEIWDIGASKFDELMGLYGIPQMHKLKKREKEEIPNDLAYYQRCFLKVLWDNEKNDFEVSDYSWDDFCKHPTYHMSIPNFPKEGVTTEGIIAPEVVLAESHKATGLETFTPVRYQSNTYNTLPAFMVTSFNGKSIRTDTPLQQWLLHHKPSVVKSAGITAGKPRKERDKQRKWDENFVSRQNMLVTNQMGFRTRGMVLDYQMKNILLDEIGARDKTQWWLDERAHKSSKLTSTENLVLENIVSGLRYNREAVTIGDCINKNIDRIERYNLPVEDYFPEYEEKKHGTPSMFLKEKKEEAIGRELTKLIEVTTHSAETTGFAERSWDNVDNNTHFRNMLIRETRWSLLPYDIYNAINEYGVRSRREEALFTAKYYIEEKDWEQNPFMHTNNCRSARTSKDALETIYIEDSHSPFAWGATSPVLMRHLKASYAASMDWCSNKSKKKRKFMMATVFDTDGREMMRIPIPSHLDRVADLEQFYDDLWDIPPMTYQEFATRMMHAWDREDETIRPILIKNSVYTSKDSAMDGIQNDLRPDERDATHMIHYEHKAFSHFNKEVISLLIGLGQFVNNPDVKIIETPFAQRRGARRRDGSHHTERVHDTERTLISKNRKLKLTGVVKKYAEMGAVTGSNGKLTKRFQVRRHPRLQPYPSRGTVEEIWIEPYWKGEGKSSARPILELQDKRGDDDA